ncbi:hypothetical protein OH773_22090 (plasmid) [Buttiauxella sp. WJP83]|uniref:hypothetical protein n=1 Tax=Buttiauxella sp. WJP83 TaxID=2986951 RepID=UPI0022DDB3A7|nr:hypothetical protein [Buttiauxella sp. WJP83]WBM72936.1 hypothetical protein OH773_22090 [Buttiauxella sp. WJP83]
MIIDNELIVILFRGLDRILISLGGIISIWLGYKLFNKALPNNGTFDGGIGSWSIRMQNIAPGVFFALFGASALIFSITHPFSYENYGKDKNSEGAGVLSNNGANPAKESSGSKFVGMGLSNSPRNSIRDYSIILNSLAVVNKYVNRPVDTLTNEQKSKIMQSYGVLYNFQINLINDIYGPEGYDTYQKMSADIRNRVKTLDDYPPEDKNLYAGIKSLYDQ